MRILISTINYTPELTGIGKYTGELGQWLSRNGYQVKVVTSAPYYPDWKVFSGYSNRFYYKENIDGVKVIRCPVYIPERPTGIKRILHLMTFAISSLPPMLTQFFWKPDVVLAIEPPLFASPCALLVSKLTGAVSWLHIQDFEVDAAFELGILKSRFARSGVSRVESMLMRKFNRVSTISPKMLEKLELKGVTKSASEYFPNWADIHDIYPIDRVSSFRNQLNIPCSHIIYLYSGNMGEKQGLDIIVEAARRLANKKNISFVMCGQGAAYKSLRVKSQGLSNMHWLDLQPIDMLNELLNLADVHLLPQRANAADLVMPSKLTGMMASGRPVLATVDEDSQIAEFIKDAGVVVPPEDVDSICDAIIRLSNDKELRKVMGEQARKYAVDNLSRDVILEEFDTKLQSLRMK